MNSCYQKVYCNECLIYPTGVGCPKKDNKLVDKNDMRFKDNRILCGNDVLESEVEYNES